MHHWGRVSVLSFVAFIHLSSLVQGVVVLNITGGAPGPSLSKRSDDETDGVISVENALSYYRATLMIGTPPQPVNVQIDTGSSDLWVISTNNPFCKSKSKCHPSSMFNPTLSSSYQPNDTVPFYIAYGDSTYAKGTFAQDAIQVGDLTVSDVNFAVAETSNSSEAVWGVGMPSSESMVRHIDLNGSVYPTYPNLPIQMKQQGLIDTVAYSLWLNDLRASKGSLLFGGVDHAKYHGDLQTVPMVSSHRDIDAPLDFSVMLHGISGYNRHNTTAKLIECSLPVLLDSGTTLTQLPAEFLEPIMKTIGAAAREENGVYLINEEKRRLLDGGGLTFNISGIEINVSFDELLIPLPPTHGVGRYVRDISGTDELEGNNDGTQYDDKDDYESSSSEEDSRNGSVKAKKRRQNNYMVGLYSVGTSTGGVYILGDTFLRSAYVVYDLENKEISLANAVYNSTSSQIESIDSNGVPGATRAPLYSSTKASPDFRAVAAMELYETRGASFETDSVSGATETATLTQVDGTGLATMEVPKGGLATSKHTKNGSPLCAPSNSLMNAFTAVLAISALIG